MSQRLLADRPGREEDLRERTPLSVALTPADVAGAVIFLASSAASLITGATLLIDGGWTSR